MLRRFIRYSSCMYEAPMSPATNRSSAIQHYKHSNANEMHNRITFNFYTGLSHIHLFVNVFPDSDAGLADEWVDIADTQSVTNTEHVTSDEIDDNLESEAEGYETDSEDNDIHSDNSADELEEHTTESSKSDIDIHDSDTCVSP